MSLLSFVSRASVLSAVLAVVAAVPASAARLIVFPPTAGVGLTKQEAVVVADAVAAATSRAGHDVVTPHQLEAVIGLETMKQLVGCDSSSCLSELGDALGAEAIVNVSVGSVGQSTIVTLKRSDTKGGANKVGDRRFKKGKGAIEGILDALPALVAEVLGGLTTTTTPTAATTPTAPTTTPTTPTAEAIGTMPVLAKDKVAAARIDEAIAAPKGLTWVHDGNGRVLAFSKSDPQKAPLYAGTSTSMYEVHNGGGSGSDGSGGFSRIFWDPRIGGGGAERSFERRKGIYTLTCGSTTTTLTELKTAPKAKFYKPAWRRQALLIGRDDSLRYVIVDADRAADPVADRRIWIGKKGKLVPLDVEIESDKAWGQGGIIAAGAGLTIKLAPTGGEIVEGTTRTPLTGLDLWDNAAMLYTEVKPWGEVQLGTPCDVLPPAKR